MDKIAVDVQDGIATAIISAPPMNAINAQMRADLAGCVTEFERDTRVRAIIIRGEGEKAFCAGFDLKELATTVGSAEKTREHLEASDILFNGLARCAKPTIASVSGLALGGGLELAVCCDIIVAGESARFGLPEIKIGAFPAGGGTLRVTRLVGPVLAKRLMMLGDPIEAAQALQWGLISFVARDAELARETAALARRLADGPALALQYLKRAIASALEDDAASALGAARRGAMRLALSNDLAAGVSSFAARQRPTFRDDIDSE
jgi:enoyl-CoA hydratase